MRLSTSSFAGTARTLVAVGTASEASMFCTIRAATPRSVVVLAPVGGGRRPSRAWPAAAFAGAAGPAAAGAGWPAGLAARRGGGGRSASAGADGAAPGASVPARAALAVAVAAVASVGVTIGRRAVGRPVVGEEVVPGRVDAGRVGEVPLVHLLDDPLVRTEARQWVVLRSLLGRHGRYRLFHAIGCHATRWSSHGVGSRLRRHGLSAAGRAPTPA